MMLPRRTLLALLGGATLAGQLPRSAAGDSRGAQAPSEFETYVRIRGRLDDALVFDHVSGSVHGTVEGAPPRLLFGLEGLQVSRYRREGPERFAVESRYLGVLVDPLTRERLVEFVNPWTGTRHEVPVTSYGPSILRLSPEGLDYGVPEAQAPRVSRREFRRIGSWVHVTESIGSGAADGQPDFDVLTFSARSEDLGRRSSGFVPAINGFTAVERWRSWMGMSDRPGTLLWHVTGTKLEQATQVPEALRAKAERHWGRGLSQALARD